MSEFDRYAELRDAGIDPKGAYLVAQENGLGAVESIHMLRQVYSLTIEEAKSVKIETDTGMTLSEYQESLLPDIEAVLKAPLDD